MNRIAGDFLVPISMEVKLLEVCLQKVEKEKGSLVRAQLTLELVRRDSFASVHLHTHTHACIHAHAHTHTHVHTHTHTHTPPPPPPPLLPCLDNLL